MEIIYYFFLEHSIDNTALKYPYPSDTFLGEIGDFIEIDGVGYIITDYAYEVR